MFRVNRAPNCETFLAEGERERKYGVGGPEPRLVSNRSNKPRPPTFVNLALDACTLGEQWFSERLIMTVGIILH